MKPTQRSKSNRPPAAAMPVRVKNSTTGAGSDSGKKPVCVCASALRIVRSFTFGRTLSGIIQGVLGAGMGTEGRVVTYFFFSATMSFAVRRAVPR